MQYSVHSPNGFIRTHLGQLLPSWSLPVLSVLVVLQLCQCALIERTVDTENYKNQLRQQFIEFGGNVALKLRAMGHLADVFDPRTGLPMNSPPGQLKLDDVAVAHSLLGYSINDSGPCTMIVHPTWGKAVYPSTLLSSAHPHVVEGVVESIVASMCHTAPHQPRFIALPPQRFAETSPNTTTLLQPGVI